MKGWLCCWGVLVSKPFEFSVGHWDCLGRGEFVNCVIIVCNLGVKKIVVLIKDLVSQFNNACASCLYAFVRNVLQEKNGRIAFYMNHFHAWMIIQDRSTFVWRKRMRIYVPNTSKLDGGAVFDIILTDVNWLEWAGLLKKLRIVLLPSAESCLPTGESRYRTLEFPSKKKL